MFGLRPLQLSLATMLALAPLANANSQNNTSKDEDAFEGEPISIVWLKEGITREQIKQIAETFAGKDLVSVYETLGGFAVRMNSVQALARQGFLKSESEKGGEGSLAAKQAFELITDFEDDGYVSLFDDSSACDQGTAEDQSASEDGSGYWLGAVGAPLKPKSGSTFASRVWIIDSGIDRDYATGFNPELNIDTSLSKSCNAMGCSGGNWNDKLGHGTMVAGIVGSIQGNSQGFVGVAPNVKLVAVKAFNNGSKARWPVIYAALDYVGTKATAGDVVNISWGARWDPQPDPCLPPAICLPPAPSNPRKIEEKLKQLAADKKLRIAIAAGNTDQFNTSGYVQTFTPARAAGFEPPLAGQLLTVSAVDKYGKFWANSAFGNGNCSAVNKKCSGPPNFAEPGVEITSLWPQRKQPQFNTCSGTSFATAIMSGLLVQQTDIEPLKQATMDPSAKEAYQADWIGGCKKSVNECIEN